MGVSRPTAAHKLKLFVEAYCTNGGNGKQAAITAGYSPKTAEVAASRLLSKDKVRNAVEKRRAEALASAEDKTLLTAHEVLQDLAQAKRFDPALMYGEDGALLPIRDMPADVRLHLEGVEFDEIVVGTGENRKVIGHTAKIKFPKKAIVRDQAMKHFGLYEKDNAQQPQAAPPMFVIVPVRARVLESK